MSSKKISRGTTPTNTFGLPFDLISPKQVWVTYAQDGVVKIDKNKDSIEVSENVITVPLTQEDTLSLDSKKMVDIQIRILTADDEALSSVVISTNVGRVLKDGVIS